MKRSFRFARAAAWLMTAALLASCTTPIPYPEGETPTTEGEDEVDDKADEADEAETGVIPETVLLEPLSRDLYSPSDYVVSETAYSESYQLEFNTDAYSYTDGLSGYNGTGFISLGDKDFATIRVTVPSSQHYKLGVRVCSTGTKLAVIVGGSAEVESADGSYTTYNGETVGAIYVRESVAFDYFYLDPIYLKKGENSLTLQVLSGIAYLDDITLENSASVPPLAYAVSTSCVSKNASEKTKTVKKYLSDIYGNRVLTGQYCTTGTNTEINAVYMDTGRYSAIRFGDLGIFTEYYEGSDKNNEDEIKAAAEWWKNGGLVGYSWYWYAPSEERSHYYADLTDFKLSAAVSEADAATLDAESLATYEQTGRITRACYNLIRDIDTVAARLKLLAAEDVPVLFRPLPEAGNGWYWWGEDAESYLWLYKLVFTRLNDYHGLTNLIWIWNGESYDYYPGDDYADLVGMDVYTDSDISSNGRMLDAIRYTIRTKPTAMTECGRVPNPDLLKRDNALWLFFALWRGDYIVDPDGFAVYDHTSHEELDYAYNNELYVTLDELPDFGRYY
ncbi:MAG: hypothetical protein NC084_09885 [Bacteroides sp.]|nr:hypothetical protein [Eubacterium sp.]MCM1419671.1 hypothetical protein [Roseburia sp.]MCM1463008.1 hypothetical protein [Bacteroides sp.]